MSNPLKSIKKIFRPVLKIASKILPYALGAAAIFFTAGAAFPALGLAGITAGGWGGAAASIGGLFGDGIVGSVVAGAIETAGYGAIAGGLTSAITGGDITKGVQQGALYGGLAGAGGSLISGLTAPAVPGAGSRAGAPGGPQVASAPRSMISGGEGAPNLIGDSGPAYPGAADLATGGSRGSTTTPDLPSISTGSVLEKALGTLSSKPEIAGGLLRGVGEGAFAYLAAGEAEDAEKRRAFRTRQNYLDSTEGTLTSAQVPRPAQGATPEQRFAWRYDPAVKQIVKAA